MVENTEPSTRIRIYGCSTGFDLPIAQPSFVSVGDRQFEFIPVISLKKTGKGSRIPLIVRYCRALFANAQAFGLDDIDTADFHRIEPLLILRKQQFEKYLFVHNDMMELYNKNCDIAWRRLPSVYFTLEARALPFAKGVFCVNRSSVERYRCNFPYLAKRVALTPTFYDERVFSFNRYKPVCKLKLRRKYGLAADRPLITFAGRLDAQKDPLFLLRAFDHVVKSGQYCHLALIGNGTLTTELTSRAASMGHSESVHFLGVRDPKELAELLYCSDVFAISSAYEGMPISVLEALASGLPVVSTQVGEVERVLSHLDNGFIASSRTVKCFAEGLRWALKTNSAMRSEKCEQSVRPFRSAEVVLNISHMRRKIKGSYDVPVC